MNVRQLAAIEFLCECSHCSYLLVRSGDSAGAFGAPTIAATNSLYGPTYFPFVLSANSAACFIASSAVISPATARATRISASV